MRIALKRDQCSNAGMSAVPRRTAKTTKPLSVAARKALVANVAKTAPAKTRAGLKRIDFRPPTPQERAVADSLAPAARRALARGTAKAA
jgi:hypothetical protein